VHNNYNLQHISHRLKRCVDGLHNNLSSPEVKLYLMVLEKLSKTEKRLEVIRGELGSSLCLITRRDHIMCRITAQTALMKFQSSENTLWTPGWKWTSYNYYMYVDHLGISIGRFC